MKKYFFKLNGCGEEENTKTEVETEVKTGPGSDTFNEKYWYGPIVSFIMQKYSVKDEDGYNNQYYIIDQDNDTTIRISAKTKIAMEGLPLNRDIGFIIPNDKILSCEGEIRIPENFKFENNGTIEIKRAVPDLELAAGRPWSMGKLINDGFLTNKGTITLGKGILQILGAGRIYNYGKIVHSNTVNISPSDKVGPDSNEKSWGRTFGRINNENGGTITYYTMKDGKMESVIISTTGQVCLHATGYCA